MIFRVDSETRENFPVVEPAVVHVDVGVARGVVPIGHEQIGHLPKQPFAEREKAGISDTRDDIIDIDFIAGVISTLRRASREGGNASPPSASHR